MDTVWAGVGRGALALIGAFFLGRGRLWPRIALGAAGVVLIPLGN